MSAIELAIEPTSPDITLHGNNINTAIALKMRSRRLVSSVLPLFVSLKLRMCISDKKARSNECYLTRRKPNWLRCAGKKMAKAIEGNIRELFLTLSSSVKPLLPTARAVWLPEIRRVVLRADVLRVLMILLIVILILPLGRGLGILGTVLLIVVVRGER